MIAKFDRATLQNIRRELNAVLEKYASANGMEMSLGNIKFSDGDFEAKLNAKIVGAKTMKDKVLESVMAARGLQEMGTGGRRLVGYNTRSYKYPFVYEQGGKRFKCSDESAAMYFKK